MPGYAADIAKPRRIASLNLCTDQILVDLVSRDRIVSLTFMAARPDLSLTPEKAAGIPSNHGMAEEILALRPDLVLAARSSMQPGAGLLERLGYRVVRIPIASSIPAIRANVRKVALAVGERARGEAMIAAFDARLRRAVSGIDGRRPMVALYWPRGGTSGRGTLANAVVRAAGLNNIAARLGMTGAKVLPLELLIIAKLDAVIYTDPDQLSPSLAAERLHHPAFRRLLRRIPSVRLPTNRLICGVPAIAGTIERLAAFRRALAKGRRR